jgi:hypothetical protein
LGFFDVVVEGVGGVVVVVGGDVVVAGCELVVGELVVVVGWSRVLRRVAFTVSFVGLRISRRSAR